MHGAGKVEEFMAPVQSTYKLEVWGSKGNDYYSGIGGLGGYSMGYCALSLNKSIYVCCGDYSTSRSDGGGVNGEGYNGGTQCLMGVSGGGASHMALTNHGELKNFGNFKNEVLIVAGGGGGSESYGIGGSGGGETGGKASGATWVIEPLPGTQFSGGQGGFTTSYSGSQNIGCPGTFGAGGSSYTQSNTDGGGGGGGGWYGGGGTGWIGPGAGGSGHINTEYISNGSMQNGVNKGVGKAVISLLAY